MRNVIQTNGVSTAFLGNLNTQSKAALIGAAFDIAEQKQTQMDADLRNALGGLRTELENRIAIAEGQVADALVKASVLESFEMGQLEEAFQAFLQTPGMQALLSDACVSVGGGSYRLGSVIETIASADKEAAVAYTRNAAGNEITTVTYTLTDGSVIPMDVTKAVDGDTGDVTYTVSTDNWKGLSATFQTVFKAQKTNQDIFGVSVPDTTYMPLSATNLVFDLSGSFVACAGEFNASDAQPELNDDGQTGN